MDRSTVWALTEAVTFLNHGSYGACPREVLAAQSQLRAQLEEEPVRFMVRELPALWDAARRALCRFLGAAPEDVVGVPNATTAVNAVLRSLPLAPGDELLTTDHAYNACRNVLDHVARERGARVVVASLPLPVAGADAVVEAVLAKVSPRTALALVDHVTSPTALVLPVERLVGALEARGVPVLVDGAHAPGMVPLSLQALGASYYTGNLHKWVCAPKGAAFLCVRRDRQAGVRPAVISHGANSPRTDRSRFQLEFDWVGTTDPTPFLCVPRALDVLASLGGPGGWPALMNANRQDALRARRALQASLGVDPICPEDLVGSMAAVRFPGDGAGLSARLLDECAIEVPIVPFQGQWLVRVSLQRHVRAGDVERLAQALRRVLEGGSGARDSS